MLDTSADIDTVVAALVDRAVDLIAADSAPGRYSAAVLLDKGRDFDPTKDTVIVLLMCSPVRMVKSHR